MKRLLAFGLALLLLMPLSASAGIAAENAAAGQTARVFLSFGTAGAEAVEGTMVYDRQQLTLVGITPLAEGWTADCTAERFLLSDPTLTHPLPETEQPLAEFYFAVSPDAAGALTVRLTEMKDDKGGRGEETVELLPGRTVTDAPERPEETPQITPEPEEHNTRLASLSVVGYTLEPAFSPQINDYSLTVSSEETALTVRAKSDDPAAVVTVSGSALHEGENTVKVTVESAGASGEYRISVKRGASVTPQNEGTPFPKEPENEGKRDLWLPALTALAAMAVIAAVIGMTVSARRRKKKKQ